MNRLATIAGAALVCAGCVPFAVYDSPALQGKVQDRTSNKPIPDAQISLVPVNKPTLISNSTTDATGHFQMKELTHRVWALPLPFDMIDPNAAVTVSAAGYRSLQTTSYKLIEAGQYKPDVIIYLDHE